MPRPRSEPALFEPDVLACPRCGGSASLSYVQQGGHQGGYFDEIAIDPINLQPGDEAIIASRLRAELTRRR